MLFSCAPGERRPWSLLTCALLCGLLSGCYQNLKFDEREDFVDAGMDAGDLDASDDPDAEVDAGPVDAGPPPFPFQGSNLGDVRALAWGDADLTVTEFWVIDTDSGAITHYNNDPAVAAPSPTSIRGEGLGVVDSVGFTRNDTLGIFTFASLTVPDTAHIIGVGARALILVATGSVGIAGEVSVSANRRTAQFLTGQTAGPGGFAGGDVDGEAGEGPGGGGVPGSTAPSGGFGGGAGGSHGGPGGSGGTGFEINGSTGGTPTGPVGETSLVPLVGGSGGSHGRGFGGLGGGGGGAIEIVAGVAISITGTGLVAASGGGGTVSTGGGGGGGGAGGAILLESPTITLESTASLVANGGGGGGGIGTLGIGDSGEGNQGAGEGGNGGLGGNPEGGDGGNGAYASTLAENGDHSGMGSGPAGGGGGGGGPGRIRINATTPNDLGASLSPSGGLVSYGDLPPAAD